MENGYVYTFTISYRCEGTFDTWHSAIIRMKTVLEWAGSQMQHVRSNHTTQYTLSFQYCFHAIACSMHAQSGQKLHDHHSPPPINSTQLCTQLTAFLDCLTMESITYNPGTLYSGEHWRGRGGANITHSRRMYRHSTLHSTGWLVVSVLCMHACTQATFHKLLELTFEMNFSTSITMCLYCWGMKCTNESPLKLV